jgi:hypothetical protein
MGRIIIFNKNANRKELDMILSKIIAKRKPIDLNKYSGKIDFGVDGLEYQLKTRSEWR